MKLMEIFNNFLLQESFINRDNQMYIYQIQPIEDNWDLFKELGWTKKSYGHGGFAFYKYSYKDEIELMPRKLRINLVKFYSKELPEIKGYVSAIVKGKSIHVKNEQELEDLLNINGFRISFKHHDLEIS